MKLIRCGSQSTNFPLLARATQADVLVSYLFRVNGDQLQPIEPHDNDPGSDAYTLPSLGIYQLYMRLKALDQNDPRQETHAELLIKLSDPQASGPGSWRERSVKREGSSFAFNVINFKLEGGQ